MDTWLLLSNLEANGERTRALQVIKSRGMPHSNQVREFVFTDQGIELIDVFAAEGKVLTGRLRLGAQGVPVADRGALAAVAAPAKRKARR